MSNKKETEEQMQKSSFVEQIELLFHEIELAIKWQRPSVLFAIYQSEYIRINAERELEQRLSDLGQTIFPIHAQETTNPGFLSLIDRVQDSSNAVFFIDGLKWECRQNGSNIIKEINKHREYFIDNSVRAVFWLLEDEVNNFVTNATECWILRHRVVDFTETPQALCNLLEVLESVWEDGELNNLDKIPLPSSPNELLRIIETPELGIQYSNHALTLGILCWRNGNSTVALKLLKASQEIAELHQDNNLQAQCQNAIALVQTSLGNLEEAISAYLQSSMFSPKTGINWSVLKRLLSNGGDSEEALLACKKALMIAPNDFMSWFDLGNIFIKLNQYQNAILAFKRSLAIAPDYKDSLVGIGQCYLNQGKYDLAINACKKAITLDVQLIQAWLILSKAHLKETKTAEAINDCENAIEIDDSNALIWNELGNAYLVEENYEKGIAAYKRAISLQSDLGWAYSSMAFAYYQLGDYFEAAMLFRQSIPLFEANKDQETLWRHLGISYSKLNESEKAAEAYKQAGLLSQNEGLVNNETLHPLEDLNESAGGNLNPFAQQVQPIAEEYPSESISTGNPQFAEATERAETMNESNREYDITTAREWNEQGNSLLKAGAFNEAINAYTKAIESANDSKWPYIKNLALAHYQIGKIRGKSSANQPEDPEIWEGDDEQAEIRILADSVNIPAAQRYDVDPNEAGGINKEPEILTPHENNTSTPPEVNENTGDANTSQTASDWNELGNSYTRKRMFDEASDAYKTAITLDPKNGFPYVNLGILYQQLGKHQIAIQLYKKSIDLLENPDDRALSLYRLGNAYRRIHEYALARDAYRKATEIIPVSNNLLMRTRFSLLDNVARS
jgi:tetratricopeptide (TPR) repeat protein